MSFSRGNRAIRDHAKDGSGRPEGPAPARVSGELSEAAQRHGMTELVVAAFDRLGVPLA
jgi:hypothetical protein